VRTALLPLLLAAACGNSASTCSCLPPGADLSGFRIERIAVDGLAIEAWLAETPAQQSQGLMNATEEQVAPLPDTTPRGMLFLFPAPAFLSFYMRDTYVALDLAYATADGTIVEVHDLVPLDLTPVLSGQPVQYALEVPAGTLQALGVGPGSVLTLPPP